MLDVKSRGEVTKTHVGVNTCHLATSDVGVNTSSRRLVWSVPTARSKHRGGRASRVSVARTRISLPATPRSWVTYNSPLWRQERIKTDQQLCQSMPTTPRALSMMETGFRNDAIVTHTLSHRRNPIIPQYNAESDKFAKSYFKSPFVQGIMERNNSLVKLKEIKSQRTVNKLSVRRRCKQTPDVTAVRERESGFVNDAIPTEKQRQKYPTHILAYKDIIPKYDAKDDQRCRGYFQRDDVRRLTKETRHPGAQLPEGHPVNRKRHKFPAS